MTKYIIKFPPSSRATWEFRLTPEAADSSQQEARICKMVVSQIGSNMPCLTVGDNLEDYEAAIYYHDPVYKKKIGLCTEYASIKFRVIF